MYLSGTLIMAYNLWRTARMPTLAARETDAELAPAIALAAE